MRVKPLLDSIRHRIGGLDKTVWVEVALFLMLAICFLFFIKPMVNSAIGSLRMPWLPSDRISLACMVCHRRYRHIWVTPQNRRILPMRRGSLRACSRVNRL